MELGGNSIIALILIAISLVDSINCTCIIYKDRKSEKFRYHCVKSGDYVSAVNRAPIDVPHVTFAISNIPTIRNGVFGRFSQNLTILEVLNSTLKEIEDNAFQGLTKLSRVNLAGNELEVVKEAWFKGLPNLETIVLSYNRIRQIDDGFFSTVSPLKGLYIDYNELTCIPASALTDFKVDLILYEFNSWSWKCLNVLINWFKNKKPMIYNLYNDDGWTLTENVTKNCIAQSTEPEPTNDFIDDCVQRKLDLWLPNAQNYTILKIFRIKERSPFLW